jgi:hypothetical protein
MANPCFQQQGIEMAFDVARVNRRSDAGCKNQPILLPVRAGCQLLFKLSRPMFPEFVNEGCWQIKGAAGGLGLRLADYNLSLNSLQRIANPQRARFKIYIVPCEGLMAGRAFTMPRGVTSPTRKSAKTFTFSTSVTSTRQARIWLEEPLLLAQVVEPVFLIVMR